MQSHTVHHTSHSQLRNTSLEELTGKVTDEIVTDKEMRSKLISKYSFCKAVRGKGLMIGVVLDRPAGALSAAILKHKLITLTAGETVLRLLPPLNITRAEADLALERIAAGLADYAKSIEA